MSRVIDYHFVAYLQDEIRSMTRVAADHQQRAEINESRLYDASRRLSALQDDNNALANDLAASRHYIEQLEQRLHSSEQTSSAVNQSVQQLSASLNMTNNCMEQTKRALTAQVDELTSKLDEKTKEFEHQRSLRRAADAYIIHQTEKQQDCRARLAAAESLISKLNLQVAELKNTVTVQSARIKTAEESQVLDPINATNRVLRLKPVAQVTRAQVTQTTPPATRNATQLAFEKLSRKRAFDDNEQRVANILRHDEQVVADGLEFIAVQNARQQTSREFDDAWKLASALIQKDSD